MTRRYAEGTTVPIERSKAELDRLLAAHGAGQRGFAGDDENGRAVVVFSMAGRQVRLEVSLPTVAQLYAQAQKQRKPPHGWRSKGEASRRAWCNEHREKVERQRWRAMLLLVKAKLEAVADGQSTVEREFLPDIVMPNGQRLETAIAPQIARAYETGTMPPLLPAYGANEGTTP